MTYPGQPELTPDQAELLRQVKDLEDGYQPINVYSWRLPYPQGYKLLRELLGELLELGLISSEERPYKFYTGEPVSTPHYALTDAGRDWLKLENTPYVMATSPIQATATSGQIGVPAIAAATLYFWSDGLVTWTLLRPKL